MNNFSDQNCLTSYNSERIEGFGHTDVLVNDLFVNANTCTFKTKHKDNSYFFKNTWLSFDMGPVSP